MNAADFMRSLAGLAFENCFNPYSDRCPHHDRAHAPQLRFELLLQLLSKATTSSVDALWIGRDLGYRGGRRTGLALTDDKHVRNHATRWGVSADLATKGEVLSERTAAVMWSVLERVNQAVFLWNVFPLHPHEPGQPFSNRQHNAIERRAGLEALAAVILLLKPKHIVTFGNDASLAIEKLGVKIQRERVRHPSYGGQAACVASLKRLYDLS